MAIGACATTEPPVSTWPEGEYWTGTKSEYAEAMFTCMSEVLDGVELVEGAYGVLELTIPERYSVPESGSEFSRGYQVYVACMDTVPPIYWPTTDEDHRLQYARWIEMYECTVEAGFEMLEGIPSFESWLERIHMDPGEDERYLTSNTVSRLVVGDHLDHNRAFFACPLDPESFW
jgi:hypothetical protein